MVAHFRLFGVMLDHTTQPKASAGTLDDFPDLLSTEFIAAWQAVLPGYDHTHHGIGSVRIYFNGDTSSRRSRTRDHKLRLH